MVATGAIGLSFLLSLVGFIAYFSEAEGVFTAHGHAEAQPEPGLEAAAHPTGEHEATARRTTAPWPGGQLRLGGPRRGTLAADGRSPQPGADLTIPLGIHIDNLTVIMFVMVTFIATLIHIYSIGYMHDDPRYPRFFTYLSLFCFSMLGWCASANIFMVFIFWELVGICSYLLIGFWYEEKTNADAANKAFIINRVGDVGLLDRPGPALDEPGHVQLRRDQPSAARRRRAASHVVATATAD